MPFNTWTGGDAEGYPLGSSEMLLKDNEDNRQKTLEAKLEKMSKDLEEVKLLNDQYQEKWALQLSQKHHIESVCDEVEMETTRTILQLQEEIAGLQSDLEGRLCSIARENAELRNMVATKEEEIRTLCLEWERAIFELTTFLLDGSKSLRDACGQVESITGSLPEGNTRIAEHISMAVKSYMEKEETIQKLESSLEDAQKMVLDMELKVGSLKEATTTLSAYQQAHNELNEDSLQLRTSLDEKTNMLRFLENEVKCKDDQLRKAEKRANDAFLLVRWLSDSQKVVRINDVAGDISIPEVMEIDATADAFCEEREMRVAHFQTVASSLSPADRDLVLEPVKQNQDMEIEKKDLKMHHKGSACCAADSQIADTNKCLKLGDWHHILHQIQKELVEMNTKLSIIQNYISTEMDLSNCSLIDNDLMDFDASSADSSSVFDSSTETESIVSGNILHSSRSTCRVEFPGKITEQIANPKSERGFVIQADNQELENTDHHVKSSILSEAAASFLRNELYATYKAFNKQNVHFSVLLKELDNGSSSCLKEQRKEALCELARKVEAGNQIDPKVFGGMTTRLDDSLIKFEEAHETVKEADFMLHALTKAYEDAKQLSCTMKQANENLMTEKESLADEIKKLKSSTYHKEENQLLTDHINSSLIEMANSVSILEECFLQVQTDVEKKFMSVFSDVLLIQQEMICLTKSLRTSLEDMFSWVMEERFASFVLNNCCVTELVSKFLFFRANHNYRSTKQEELYKFSEVLSSAESVLATRNEGSGKRDQRAEPQILQEKQDLPNSNLMHEHVALKKELERKEELLDGLFFDLRLLQELASNEQDVKEETEKLITSLSQVRYELEIKTNHLGDTLVQNRKLEGSLAETERALSTSNHELKLAQELIGKLTDQNAELREILKELYSKKAEAEEQLNEQKDAVKGLEKEIVNLTSSLENSDLSLLEGIEDELRKAIIERDQLREEVSVLNDKLQMAYSLADEKEAIAVEARQESEASKLYAEQKEEEVKILEHSVEELEGTINVLEKKVYEMDEEVGRHHLIRDSLEKQLQALEERLQAVDSLPQNADSDITNVQPHENQLSRKPSRKITELREALDRIRILEDEKAEQDKQCKEYISEVVLHAEAQASQYQQKYKNLESMFLEVKKEMSNLTSTAPLDKVEKSSVRARGSSSPFRCISNLVHQMNQEKDQELSVTKLRVEELEALAASRQKEVCLLRTRLAATESMTHDVIRDLLDVKMDITNYATLVDQNQILKLVEEAHNLREKLFAKEKEVHNQSLLINELIEERESCKLKLRSKDADIIASQIAIQRLQERDQLLSAHSEMLKMDKTNLMKRVAELDDMVKTLSATRDNQLFQQSSKIKNRSSEKLGSAEITRRLSQYERLLFHENDKLVQHCKSSANNHTARPPA